MKVALVHDYLSQDGGAEAVLRTISKMWPEAPIFVLFYDPEKSHPYFMEKDVYLSPMQHYPFVKQFYKWYLPMMPYATEELDLRDFDVVISSTSAFAKGVITHPGTIHISYCHTPTRYLWSEKNSYISEMKYPMVLQKLAAPILHRLRQWDQMSAERVDVFVANSKLVADRIKKYYGAPSVVIYPPVDVAAFTPSDTIGNYYLAGGRLVPYKRFELIVKAFSRLKIPLKIFGEGPMLRSLRRMAGPNIEFLGRVDDEAKAKLYAEAIAYIHPQEEDFGITAVEAQAAGTPVIAWGKGGAMETVKDGETGVYLDEQSWEELAGTVINFDRSRFNPEKIHANAERFNSTIFEQKFRQLVEKSVAAYK